jgi:hypothetical protein
VPALWDPRSALVDRTPPLPPLRLRPRWQADRLPYRSGGFGLAPGLPGPVVPGGCLRRPRRPARHPPRPSSAGQLGTAATCNTRYILPTALLATSAWGAVGGYPRPPGTSSEAGPPPKRNAAPPCPGYVRVSRRWKPPSTCANAAPALSGAGRRRCPPGFWAGGLSGLAATRGPLSS